jgi:hypothetical protein
MGVLYTYYRVRKLRSAERMAAIARGVEIPWGPELSQGVRSRRWGIVFLSGAIGYIAAMVSIARLGETDGWAAAAMGLVPIAVGIGFFIDWSLLRRDLRASS